MLLLCRVHVARNAMDFPDELSGCFESGFGSLAGRRAPSCSSSAGEFLAADCRRIEDCRIAIAAWRGHFGHGYLSTRTACIGWARLDLNQRPKDYELALSK